MELEIVCVTRRGALIAEVNRLLAQLSPKHIGHPLTQGDLEQALANPNFYLVIARDRAHPGTYLGMATMFFHRNIDGWLGEMHDVVVDGNVRGQGIGELLVQSLLEIAQGFCKVRGVSLPFTLTTHPGRGAANALYRKLGFTLIASACGPHGTNLYKMFLGPDGIKTLA